MKNDRGDRSIMRSAKKLGGKSRQMSQLTINADAAITAHGGIIEIENDNIEHGLIRSAKKRGLQSGQMSQLSISADAGIQDETAQCTLNKASNIYPLLPEIFGMNQINGAVYTKADFDDEILKEAPEVLWSGQMRFPGGTVGNFWYMPNATYSEFPRCQIAGGDSGGGNSHGVSKDFCDEKAEVDKRGGFTFSTKKFVEGFGSSSPVNSPNGALYMLNVLQVDTQEIKRQIDHLKWVADATQTKVSYLEFGNELFLMTDKFYKSVIPDPDTYWAKVKDGLEYAKEKLGQDVIRMVPFAYPFCQGECHSNARTKWNQALNTNHDLFEAVTVHEYTGCKDSIDSIDKDKRIQSMLAWGDAALTRQTKCVEQYANLKNKPIWITEWSLANFAGVPLWGDPASPDTTPFDETKYATKTDVTASALNGIFKAAHLLKAVARSHETDNPVKAMHHQLMNDADYSGYGKGAGLTQLRDDGLYISPAGQIVSHLSWIALKMSSKYRRVTPEACGGLGFDVNTESGLGCLQAVAFEDPSRIMPFYAVINRCDTAKSVRIDTSALASSDHLKLRKVTYGSSMPGNWTKVSGLERYQQTGSYMHPWKDGPITLSQDNGRITYKPSPFNDKTTVSLWKTSLSIIDFIDS
jgi:hypothetical protein